MSKSLLRTTKCLKCASNYYIFACEDCYESPQNYRWHIGIDIKTCYRCYHGYTCDVCYSLAETTVADSPDLTASDTHSSNQHNTVAEIREQFQTFGNYIVWLKNTQGPRACYVHTRLTDDKHSATMGVLAFIAYHGERFDDVIRNYIMLMMNKFTGSLEYLMYADPLVEKRVVFVAYDRCFVVTSRDNKPELVRVGLLTKTCDVVHPAVDSSDSSSASDA